MKRAPRILNITKFYHPYKGGMETVVKNMTEMNRKAGIISDVLCSNDKFKGQIDVVERAHIYRVPRLITLKGTSICPSMPFQLRQIAPLYDLLHVHFPDPMTALSLYLTKPSTPFILHWHSDIIKQKRFMPFFLSLQNWCLQEARKIIVTSQTYAEHSEYLKDYLEKVEVVPIGIQSNIKPKTKTPGSYKKVLSVGRLTEYKGYNILIKAFQYLPESFHLTIVGDGELYPTLINQILTLGLHERVEIKRNVSSVELEELYNSHDIFCLASNKKSEAFGVVLIEAMSHSLPIVACNISGSGVPWVNANNISGLNTDINDPEKLSMTIENIFQKDNYARFSRQGYERFLELFHINSMMNQLWNLYSDVLPEFYWRENS